MFSTICQKEEKFGETHWHKELPDDFQKVIHGISNRARKTGDEQRF